MNYDKNENHVLFNFDGCNISITDFNKMITKLYKTSNNSVFEIVDHFINSNALSFSDMIRVLKKITPYYVKSKNYSFVEIENYIFSKLSVFSERNDADSIINISEILHRIKNSYGIDYLKNKLLYCESNNDIDISFFDAYVLLSDFYFEENELETSFQVLRRSSLLVTNFHDHFDYLWKQKVFSEKAAKICFYDKSPKYADYLYYAMVAFALDTARDLTAFPIHSMFSFRSGNHFCEVIIKNELTEISFEKLQIINYKTEIQNEYIDFIYNKLPKLYGIPQKYISIKTTSEIIQNMQLNKDEWVALEETSKKIKNSFVDELNINISEYVSNLLRKFLDKKES